MGKFGTNAGSVIWPKWEPMEINQVIEAMPGSVVPLAMFLL